MAVRAKALQILKFCNVIFLHVFDLNFGMMNLDAGGSHIGFIVLGWIHLASFAVEEAVFCNECGLLFIG